MELVCLLVYWCTFPMKKLTVALLFGGKSGEHEVSLRSAASILKALDREKYHVIPIGITKEGQWRSDPKFLEAAFPDILSNGRTVLLPQIHWTIL